MNKRKKQLMTMDDQTLNKTIKIEGTEFDRRRVLSPKKVERLKELYAAGLNFAELARVFNISNHTAKMYIDPNYREHRNNLTHEFLTQNKRSSPSNEYVYHKMADLANYKRKLIARNQLAV